MGSGSGSPAHSAKCLLFCAVALVARARWAAFAQTVIAAIVVAISGVWLAFSLDHGKLVSWNEPWTPATAFLAVLVAVVAIRSTRSARAA